VSSDLMTLPVMYMQCCHRSGNGQGKKIVQEQGKVKEFYFESGKIDILMKS